MTDALPDKLHFKIGEVSKIAEVAPHVLRYWESEFSLIKPKRMGSGQRLYRRADVELILTIKHLLHGQGYTIAGARKLLEETEGRIEFVPLESRSSEPHVPIAESGRLESIKRELMALKELLSKEK